MKKYQIIYADPPWYFSCGKNSKHYGGAEAHYKTMRLDNIKRLAVGSLADEDCCLFMWVLDSMLPQALELLNAWGFKYKTVAFTWVKTNKGNGKPWFGMGYWTRCNPEQCLLATKGKPKRFDASVAQLIIENRGKHSRKPSRVKDDIVRLCGDLPRIELFAREKTPGWDVWGNEVESDISLKPEDEK